ncbi:RHS repeat-associated core domain-containing protein [Peribacillus frigoritolerans]
MPLCRYRYDSETKLYYLQQRYYNSEIGRFLTLDPPTGRKRESNYSK